MTEHPAAEDGFAVGDSVTFHGREHRITGRERSGWGTWLYGLSDMGGLFTGHLLTATPQSPAEETAAGPQIGEGHEGASTRLEDSPLPEYVRVMVESAAEDRDFLPEYADLIIRRVRADRDREWIAALKRGQYWPMTTVTLVNQISDGIRTPDEFLAWAASLGGEG